MLQRTIQACRGSLPTGSVAAIKICNRNNIVLLGKTNKVEEQIRPSVTLRWRVSVGLSECPSLGSRRTPYNSGIGYEASQARRHLPQKRLSTVVGPIVRTLERRLRQINCNDSPQKKGATRAPKPSPNQRRNKETGCIGDTGQLMPMANAR